MKEFLEYLEFNKKYSSYTVINYENDLLKLEEFLNKRKIKLNDLDYKMVNEFIIFLKENRLNSVSINRILSAARTYFKFLEKKKVVSSNPFKLTTSLKKDKRLPNYFKYNDFIDMIDSIDTNTDLGIRNRALFELLLATGARVSEVVNIKTNDINISLGEIKVLGKGNKERIVYINEHTKEALLNYLNNSRNNLIKEKNDYLFLNHLGTKLTDRGVRVIIDNIIKKSAISLKITPHTFRHSFATMMLNEGCDLKSVQELLGHVNLSTTSIYTHLSNEQIKNVYLHTHPRNKKWWVFFIKKIRSKSFLSVVEFNY